MATIEVSAGTHSALQLAARLTGMTVGEVVDRLVAQGEEVGIPSVVASPSADESPGLESGGIRVYADYDGRRTHGVFDPVTTRIDITSGPLAGKHFKTPSSAARAVVAQARPAVNANRNGWHFWSLDDGSGRFLQWVRRAQRVDTQG